MNLKHHDHLMSSHLQISWSVSTMTSLFLLTLIICCHVSSGLNKDLLRYLPRKPCDRIITSMSQKTGTFQMLISFKDQIWRCIFPQTGREAVAVACGLRVLISSSWTKMTTDLKQSFHPHLASPLQQKAATLEKYLYLWTLPRVSGLNISTWWSIQCNWIPLYCKIRGWISMYS